METQNTDWKLGKPAYPKDNNTVHLIAVHQSSEKKSRLSFMSNTDKCLLAPDDRSPKPKVYDCQNEKYVDMRSDIETSYDTLKCWEQFRNSLIFIDPIRHYDRTTSSTEECCCDFDGSKLIDELKEINSKNKIKWVDYREKMGKWLCHLLSEQLFNVVMSNNTIRFELVRGEKRIEAELEQLGTGVAQLFMILSYLFINKDRQMNVFMEEPECNLHPDAGIKLIQILEHEFKNHHFFISTHSAMLIDQVNTNWSIHRMLRRKDQASRVYPCTTIVQKYELLDELGIKASQLLQSNLIIWVEGPSDRIYLKKWITDLSNKQLEDGKHYTFLMYGGSNLSNYDLLADEKFIDILGSSRYAVLVCDSDKSNENDELKERVQRINDKIETLKQTQKGDEKDITNYVDIWITAGREIENYIPKETFIKILSSDEFKKKYFRESKKNVNLHIDETLITNENFDKFASFDQFFSKMYKLNNDKQLDDDQLKKISSHYTNLKVEIAKNVVQNWNDKDFDILDLKDRIEEIIDKIKTANGFSDGLKY